MCVCDDNAIFSLPLTRMACISKGRETSKQKAVFVWCVCGYRSLQLTLRPPPSFLFLMLLLFIRDGRRSKQQSVILIPILLHSKSKWPIRVGSNWSR